MQKALLVALGGVLVLFVGVFVVLLPQTKQTKQANQNNQNSQAMLPQATIQIKNDAGTTTLATLLVELATTPQEQTQGLSGRSALAEGTGMLFVFDHPAIIGFWMKDMQFPLDIIFADADGRVVSVYPNLSPDTYPKTFAPRVPARYVLEVPAGFAAQVGIAIGTKIVL